MPTFRDVRVRFQISGFQCHHLIPIEVSRMSAFRNFFERMFHSGFDLDDFRMNGEDHVAAAFGLPLHRGPHPAYNLMVAERLALIARLDDFESSTQFGVFLRSLRAGMRADPNGDLFRQRSPFQPLVDLRKLDSDADFLFRFTQLS